MESQSITVANDDLLWILDGVMWDDSFGVIPSLRGIETLIESPTKFVRDNSILVYKTKRDGTRFRVGKKPNVKSPFVILFKEESGADTGPVCVQGIHNTSILTVRPKGGMVSILDTGIPDLSPIRVTLVGNPIDTSVTKRHRAYIHWEINPKGPTAHTTPTNLKNHVIMSLRFPEKILKDYIRRLNSFSATAGSNYKVFFVDKSGNGIRDLRGGKEIEVHYGHSEVRGQGGIVFQPEIKRELICQGIDSEKQLASVKPVISCNSDIGNYYVDTNGKIQIIIDTTIVKFY